MAEGYDRLPNRFKIEIIVFIIAILLVLFNSYWFAHSYCVQAFDSFAQYLDFLFFKLGKTGLFVSPFVPQLIAGLMFGFFLIVHSNNIPKDDKYRLFGFISLKLCKSNGIWLIVVGCVLYSCAPFGFMIENSAWCFWSYILLSSIGLALAISGADILHKLNNAPADEDYFDQIQQSNFPQEEKLIENEYSVNLPTTYRFGNETRHGWINIVNPFRANLIMGTPGSGKSFTFINEFIRQHIAKGFAMYVYDYKFPTLTEIAYNHYLLNRKKKDIYPVEPQFCIINFNDARYTHRCNPIDSRFMEGYLDCKESAETLLYNLNREWAKKQGDFFIDSAKSITTTCMEYLRTVEGGKYCTLPHLIELVNRNAADVICTLASYDGLRIYIQSFLDTLRRGVFEQLQGQMSSAQVSLATLSDKKLYWVLSGNDFSLDVNSIEQPKILCTGNDPERENVYGTALSLINGRLVKTINKPGRKKMSFIVDELPTIYFRGIDRLIGTARSNKVCVCLGYQDNSQLVADYGREEADKIINTPGNIIAGQVKGDTARKLQELIGKNKQIRRNVSDNDGKNSVSYNEGTGYMVPEEKIAQLSQGNFVGILSDDFGAELKTKVFHARVDMDVNKIKSEEKSYKPLPQVNDFNDVSVLDLCKEQLNQIKEKGLYYGNLEKETVTSADVASLPDMRRAIARYKKILLLSGKEYRPWLDELEKAEIARMDQALTANFNRIKNDINNLLSGEIDKIYDNRQYDELRSIHERIAG